MSSKKKYLIAVILILTIVAVVCATYLTIPSEETEYMNISEFYSHTEYRYYSQNDEFREGLHFDIRDKVQNSLVLRFPTLVFDPGQAEVGFDLLNETAFTFVYFESRPDSLVGFLGNVTERFPEGEVVEFRMETQEYSVAWNPLNGDPNRTLVEPVYVTLLFDEYYMLMGKNAYSIADFEGTLVNNSTQLLVELKAVGDYYPMPFEWANVTVTMCQDLWCEDTVVQPTVELYDTDDSLLGTLNSTTQNLSISANIEPGQYLLVSYDPQYSSYFLLFEAFMSESVPDFPWAHFEVP